MSSGPFLPIPRSILRLALRKFGQFRYTASGEAALLPLRLSLKKDQLRAEYKGDALHARLIEIDAERPIKRIYVMGCGRSGTWLLTAVMSTFKGVCVVSKELPVEYFAQLSTCGETLILKRNSQAYQQLCQISELIEIVYIVRHPFDVLTSKNRQTDRLYHITPERWAGEIIALKRAIEARRAKFKVFRYEDLVDDPSRTQFEIAKYFGLEIVRGTDDVTSAFKATKAADIAMHGVRKVNKDSIGKYKDDPCKMAYLREVSVGLDGLLEWTSEAFGYDVSLA